MGCMGLTHAYGRPLEKYEAIKVIRAAFDMGYTFFDTADNLRVDIKFPAYLDYSVGMFAIHINLHPMSHVEYLIHFLPVRLTFFTYNSE